MTLAIPRKVQLSARGLVHRVTFRDEDGSIRNVDSATLEIVFRAPDGTETRRTAANVGGGSGQGTYTDTAGDHNNAVGWWTRWGTADFGGGVGPFPSTAVRYEVVAEGDAPE